MAIYESSNGFQEIYPAVVSGDRNTKFLGEFLENLGYDQRGVSGLW